VKEHNWFLFSVWVVLLGVGLAAGQTLAGGVPEALVDRAARESIRVIVQLRVSARPEGELGSPDAVASQRQAIAAAQSAALKELAGASYRVVRTYETIPFLALEVSLGALQALDESALVVGVEEDRLDSPQRTPADEHSCIPR